MLNNCLPNTPYDVIVEHAIQFERVQELEKNQNKLVKRKINECDQEGEDLSETECKIYKIIRKETEKQRRSFQ